jgi:hypothetical protein
MLQIRLKNLEEDLDETRKKEANLLEFETRYRDETVGLAGDIQEMESRKDRKKELLEDMHGKLKAEIENVMRELKNN